MVPTTIRWDTTVDTVTDSFTRMMPVANPTYTEVGWETVGSQKGTTGDDIIADLNRAADMIDAARLFAFLLTGELPPPVDQLFGVTVRGGGLSDPAWFNNGESGSRGAGWAPRPGSS